MFWYCLSLQCLATNAHMPVNLMTTQSAVEWVRPCLAVAVRSKDQLSCFVVFLKSALLYGD